MAVALVDSTFTASPTTNFDGSITVTQANTVAVVVAGVRGNGNNVPVLKNERWDAGGSTFVHEFHWVAKSSIANIGMFLVINPPAVASTFHAAPESAKIGGAHIAVATFSGVDLRDPIESIVTGGSSGNSSLVSITVSTMSAGGLVFVATHGFSSDATTIQAGGTELWNSVSTNSHLQAGYRNTTGTIGWDGSSSRPWAGIGIALRPGGATSQG